MIVKTCLFQKDYEAHPARFPSSFMVVIANSLSACPRSSKNCTSEMKIGDLVGKIPDSITT